MSEILKAMSEIGRMRGKCIIIMCGSDVWECVVVRTKNRVRGTGKRNVGL